MPRAAQLILWIGAGTIVVVLACFLGFAIRYRIGWPDWLRNVGTLAFAIVMPEQRRL